MNEKQNSKENESKNQNNKNLEEQNKKKFQKGQGEEKLCKFFARGKICKYGKDCRYEHAKLCRYRARGICKYGEKCKQSHDTSNVCYKDAKGEKCKYGEKCRFVHINSQPRQSKQGREDMRTENLGRYGGNQEEEIGERREQKQVIDWGQRKMKEQETTWLEEQERRKVREKEEEKQKQQEVQEYIGKAIKEQINFLKEGIILEMKKHMEEAKMQTTANKNIYQMPRYYQQATDVPAQTQMQQQYYYTR